MKYKNNIFIVVCIFLGIVVFLLLNIYFFEKGVSPKKENNKSSFTEKKQNAISDEYSELVKSELINLFESKKYESILQKYNDIRKEYNLQTESGKELVYINEAATIMNNLIYKSDESFDDSIINNFKEANTFVIAMLRFRENDKLELFIKEESLVPTTFQTVDIISCDLLGLGESKSEVLKEVYDKGFTNHKLYEVKILLDNELLSIFVIQNRNTDICKIYTISSDKKDLTKFKTVEYYHKINNIKID